MRIALWEFSYRFLNHLKYILLRSSFRCFYLDVLQQMPCLDHGRIETMVCRVYRGEELIADKGKQDGLFDCDRNGQLLQKECTQPDFLPIVRVLLQNVNMAFQFVQNLFIITNDHVGTKIFQHFHVEYVEKLPV